MMGDVEMSEVISLQTRRAVFRGGVLSVGAMAVLTGEPVMAAAARRSGRGNQARAGDVDILNVALALEHEAIEAYQIGAESGLLTQPVLALAVDFQSHHKAHRDALASTIATLGGRAVATKTRADYVAGLEVAKITTAIDALRLAARLEKGAANTYLGVIPSFSDRALAQVSARLAADETMHWTALARALGDELPKAALTFGA
jgi:rubrerythrin